MSKAAVLLVEDNPKIMEANVRIFEQAGYEVHRAETLARARESLAAASPSAIVLDIKLPDGNGLDFIAEIRESTTAPVLLLTALSESDERLQGLRAGGDDYITKPYNIDELVLRVEAFLRRDALQSEKLRAIKMGPLTLDHVAMRAFLDGEDMRLSPKEFAVLRFLAMNEGETLSADYLYEEVWKQPMNDDKNALKSVVKRLRKKMEGCAYAITAEYSEGYRFQKEK